MTGRKLIISGLILALTVFTGTTLAAPHLSIDDTEFFFGFAPQNAKITHTFVLTNTGTDTVKITKVIPGCGCTKAPLEKDVLAAGESTNLEIIFSTGKYSGRVAKSPKIVTDEGTAPKRIRIISNIVSRPDSTYPLLVNPYKIDISQFGDKVRREMKFKIKNVSKDNLRLSLIDSPGDLVEIDMPAGIRGEEEVEGTITLKDAALDMNFQKSFTIGVNDAQSSRFTVPLLRSVRKGHASASKGD